jgi:16S rRNA (guanine527-N7)-methyltransferase
LAHPPIEFAEDLGKLGLSLSADRLDLLAEYAVLLSEWNTKVNMVSRRDIGNLWNAHILHSLAPLAYLDIPTGTVILDLGTGGGLPGIPLAIAREDLEVVLVDSIRKKTRAVEDIAARLNLQRVRILTGRAEELRANPGMAGQFDMVIARAVAPLGDLVRWARPFTSGRSHEVTRVRKKNSHGRSEFHFPYLLALKGGEVGEEIRKAATVMPQVTITEIDIHLPREEDFGFAGKKILIVEF